MKTEQLVLAPVRRLWCSGMANIMVVVILLVVQNSSTCCLASSQHQNLMRWNHPKRELLDRINRKGPYVGIVMAYSTEEIAMKSSGFFIQLSLPFGRKFNIGSIKGTKVIYVMSGQRRNLGSKNVDKFTEMKIGNYNLPKEGQILLGEIEFKPEEFFSVGQPMKEVLWLEIDKTWFKLAAQLKGMEYGLRGATADIFLDTAAYRKFIFKEFQVSTVDEESSAVVMTAMSSGVPSIVIRRVSDLAGGEGTPVSPFLGSLATVNTLNVTIKFIELIGVSSNTLVTK
ncbi:hypothetical protein MKW98_018245 [Papaver atlanticum]|uniref:Nucleoside phosphorylase domain-containing protein n=1 Tax=Papaver atlanticum TaxID=357466 RepID=A0AAD4S5L5_9MAGN|nr:hypothetical protein MKW98_018245 [Papaver atlanticum]